MIQRTQRILLPVLGFALVLIAWEIAGRWFGNALFAPPSHVVVEYLVLLQQGEMLSELLISLRQMVVGFAMACAIGMPLGVVMGRSATASAIFLPWVSMFVVTSTAALIPVFILLLGTGLTLRVTIVFLSCVWYIVLTIYDGARGIRPDQIAVARSFSATPLQIFWKVIVPALHPYFITAAGIGLVHAIRAMVLAEMLVIVGYGGLIHRSGLSIDTAPLLGLLLTLMIASVLFSQALRAAGRWLAPWYELQRLPT
jgi:ABC-type nitrate/sulfonate/bicarbonate transport system permease component